MHFSPPLSPLSSRSLFPSFLSRFDRAALQRVSRSLIKLMDIRNWCNETVHRFLPLVTFVPGERSAMINIGFELSSGSWSFDRLPCNCGYSIGMEFRRSPRFQTPGKRFLRCLLTPGLLGGTLLVGYWRSLVLHAASRILLFSYYCIARDHLRDGYKQVFSITGGLKGRNSFSLERLTPIGCDCV